MPRRQLICALLLHLLVGGCGLNGSDNDPRLYLDQYRENFDGTASLSVTWWYPPGGATGYVLEQVDPGGGHVEVGRYDAKTTRADVVIAPASVPGPVEFRVRVEPAARISNAVVVQRTLAAPRMSLDTIGAFISGSFTITGFVVHYDAIAAVTDRIVLSRRLVAGDASASSWVALATTHTATNTYVDNDLAAWMDGASYEYQAVVYVGDAGGTPSVVKSVTALYLPPRVVSLTATAAGARLQFVVDSRYAQDVRVYQHSSGSSEALVAILPPPQPGVPTTFDVPLPSPGVYAIRLAVTEKSGATSPSAERWVPVHSSPDLNDSLTDLAEGHGIVRTAAGEYSLVGSVSAGFGLFPPGDDGSHAFSFGRTVYHYSGTVLDPAGRPHIVLTNVDTQLVVPILHAWHDGQDWRTEEIGRGPYSALPDLAMGTDGTLIAAWVASDNSVTVAHQSNGIWSTESSPPITTGYPFLIVAGDENASPHVIVNSSAQPAHAWRDSSGWHSEPVPPLPPEIVNPTHRPFFLSASRGTVVFADYVTGPAYNPYPTYSPFVVMNIRSATGWATPETISFLGHYGGVEVPYRGAQSADGTRVAIAAPDGHVLVYEGGSRRAMYAWPRLNGVEYGMGFDAAGKVWVVQYITDSGGSIVPRPGNAVLYQEP